MFNRLSPRRMTGRVGIDFAIQTSSVNPQLPHPMTSQDHALFSADDVDIPRTSTLEDGTDHTAPLLGPPGSASQQPSQPLRMNILLGTAPLAQVGIWGITLTIWYNVIFRANWILFSFHPVPLVNGLWCSC